MAKEESPKSAINNLPNELLIEVFDFYRQDVKEDYYRWSMNLGWFKLIHVCRRWRIVVLGSSSCLDLRFVLTPKIVSGKMKTIMSHHFPPLPVEINYNFWSETAKDKDFARMPTHLKPCDRIRGITFAGQTADLNKFFKKADCPFPALESLDLHCVGDRRSDGLAIPDTFLRGSNLHLQSLELKYVRLSATLRLLTSAPALTKLDLGIVTSARDSKSPMSLFLICLQSIPCLQRLKLKIRLSPDEDSYMHWPKAPKITFPLTKLTFFCYFGPSDNLNTLMAGFSAPSLQFVEIYIRDSPPKSLPSTLHLFPRFIDGLGEGYHGIQVVLKYGYFELSLLTHFECVGHQAPSFRLRIDGHLFSSSEWIMKISNVFSARRTMIEELSVVFTYNSYYGSDMVIVAWRAFFQRFPSVKLLRLKCTSNIRIAKLFHQDHGGPDLAFMPALEEIEIDLFPFSTSKNSEASEVLQQFASSCQRAGRPVKVSLRPPSSS